MKKKFIISLLTVFFAAKLQAQDSLFLTDTTLFSGKLIVDEFSSTMRLASHDFNLHKIKSTKKLKHRLNEFRTVVQPIDVDRILRECRIVNETGLEIAMKKIYEIGRFYRLNGDQSYDLIFKKNDKYCYAYDIKCVITYVKIKDMERHVRNSNCKKFDNCVIILEVK